MNEGTPYGIAVLDKPAGLSSNRVLEQLKRLLGVRGRRGPKLGYLGTLDPLATGVLPVFVGKATRLISCFEGLSKTYRATLRLGRRTDTLDAEGTVTAEADPQALAAVDAAALEAALDAFRGGYAQQVPAYSAVKVGGVPAYRLARAGQPVPERVRTVQIHHLALEALDLPAATLLVTVSAGTYVRSLVDDLGQRLGVGAHLTALRRLACGDLFTEANCFSLERIEAALARGDRGFLMNPTAFLSDHLPLLVQEETERHVRDGRSIPVPGDTARLLPAAKAMALRPCGTLVAVGEVVQTRQDAWAFQPSRVLV